jgi:DNA-binding transcriptional ArsR family regulator
MKEIKELAEIFKALSDPNRLAILQALRECCGPGCCAPEEGRGNTVSKIAGRFDLSLSTVSHHLKELRKAGLIRCEKRGQQVVCTPDPEVLRLIEEFLAD